MTTLINWVAYKMNLHFNFTTQLFLCFTTLSLWRAKDVHHTVRQHNQVSALRLQISFIRLHLHYIFLTNYEKSAL